MRQAAEQKMRGRKEEEEENDSDDINGCDRRVPFNALLLLLHLHSPEMEKEAETTVVNGREETESR